VLPLGTSLERLLGHAVRGKIRSLLPKPQKPPQNPQYSSDFKLSARFTRAYV
jgi:hypothetical protein